VPFVEYIEWGKNHGGEKLCELAVRHKNRGEEQKRALGWVCRIMRGDLLRIVVAYIPK
jgi:hypothetical protein